MTATEGTIPIRLNIGAGDIEIDGFTPIDRKFGTEAYPLAYPDESVEEIRASHILEHFGWDEVLPVLKDWVRVLRPGGRIRIAVPDVEKIVANKDDKWKHYIMGGQMHPDDYHKSCWNRHDLEQVMRWCGITEIKEWQSPNTDTACLPISLNLEGIKATEGATAPAGSTEQLIEFKIPFTEAVMAAPRLAFTDNMLCVQHLVQKGISFTVNRGCFWGALIERAMQESLDRGAEWVITLDYDTVFTPDAFDRMLYLFQKYPHIDALAPIQMKRESENPLFWDADKDNNPRTTWEPDELNQDVMPIKHAHFGLTMFRASALRKMAHPWFYGQPNDGGEWTEGRQDDDIYFWEKWRSPMVGNNLYLANRVVVGHMQMVVTWPNQEMKPMHQYVTEFNRVGEPEGVWR